MDSTLACHYIDKFVRSKVLNLVHNNDRPPSQDAPTFRLNWNPKIQAFECCLMHIILLHYIIPLKKFKKGHEKIRQNYPKLVWN